MAIKKFTRQARQALTDANRAAKTIARTVNRVDRDYGILGSAAAQQIMPYVNAAAYAIDAFDALMPSMGVSTPQLVSGMSAGVSQTMQVKRNAPKVTGSKGNVRITHKELIGDVTMVAALATSVTNSTGNSLFYLSPSNSNLFPWLADIASNYDYFKFNRVRIVYVPLCATSLEGRVMLGYDPDATDSLTYSRASLSSYKCSTESSAWGTQYLDCDLPNNQPWYQTNSLTNTAMYSTSTQGQVFWATWAGAATKTCGEWYVLYDVSLKDPQPSLTSYWKSTGTGGVLSTNFPSDAPTYYLGSDAVTVRVGFASPGNYQIQWFAATTAATGTIGFNTNGAIAAIATSQKVSDGTNAIASAAVIVTGGGWSTGVSTTTNLPYIQLGSLTALGAWTVLITKVTIPVNYP